TLEKNIVDFPGRRKIHKKVTPSMGGIAIFLGFFIASFVWIDIQQWKEIRYILLSLGLMFIFGVRDDLMPLRATMKLIGQALAASMLIFLFDFRLTSLHGLFGINEIPLWLSYVITYFTIIVITNSFNLIDGIDGLAGTLASLSLLAFGTWFFLVDDLIFATLAYSMAGGIIAFLKFNWDPSEIFMGDTGAIVIGFSLSIFAIHLIELNNQLPVLTPFRFTSSIAPSVCFLLVPLVDTLRVFILRSLKGRSPLSPDKNHLHHGLIRLGLPHGKAAILLGAVQGIFIISAFTFSGWTNLQLLTSAIVLAIILSVILDRLLIRKLDIERQED
ncbi:MAG: undecaprenyl/decaprenyl-phosphate alpha-N-acetylglucosaminyl 1-phosphate transferase, partial [Flammeovirgaceae bacterium]|nr:undecaprenyl/decaprenyl-phosphate alpha-N-acetylglucosaminyl 1-phosphate transferase [Flammeovirgaceae bacterium]